MVVGNNKSATTIKIQANRWQFRLHADAAVQRGLHHLLEHGHGFTRSHWMPSLGKCLCRIATAAIMVDKFVETTQNTNKTQLLPSNYGTFRVLVVCAIGDHHPAHFARVQWRREIKYLSCMEKREGPTPCARKRVHEFIMGLCVVNGQTQERKTNVSRGFVLSPPGGGFEPKTFVS